MGVWLEMISKGGNEGETGVKEIVGLLKENG